eukprot:967281-Pyramimonas_sp.AAC.1
MPEALVYRTCQTGENRWGRVKRHKRDSCFAATSGLCKTPLYTAPASDRRYLGGRGSRGDPGFMPLNPKAGDRARKKGRGCTCGSTAETLAEDKL